MVTKGNRFLNIYGWTLIAFFCGCLYILWITFEIENDSVSLDYFGITISLWYLATGIGILARQNWGYYLFKLFLYVLLICFPIGTIVSYMSLKYMKANNIKSLFGN